jgi:hypothetical protein
VVLHIGRTVEQWRMIANALRIAAGHEDFEGLPRAWPKSTRRALEQLASDLELQLPLPSQHSEVKP